MREGKIAATREAAKLIVDRLGPTDRLGIVTYSTEVETLLKPEPLRDREGAKRTIDAVTTGGTTNLSGGWLLGLKYASRVHSKRSVTRVVLMTDGLANRGVTAAEKLGEIARNYHRKGIVTSTMGFGEEFNEECLTEMASAGGGNFHYIRHADDASRIFLDELRDVLSVAAQNVVFTLRPARGFHLREILNNYHFGEVEGGMEVFAGDVYTGEDKTLLLRMQTRPGPAGIRPALHAEVECDLVAAEHAESRLAHEVEVEFRAASGPVEPSEIVLLELGLLRSARARRKAMALADAGEYRKAEEVLVKCVKELDAQRICAERMRAEIEEMKRYAMSFAREQWSPDGRKALSQSVYLSGIGRLMNRRDKLIDTRVDEENEPRTSRS
jgi:Ca-activated chloride channel family protein